MIPLRDNIPYRSLPIVNYSIIALCTVLFLLQLADEADQEAELVERYGMIPALVLHPDEPVTIREFMLVRGQPMERERQVVATVNPWLTLVTCIFLHGGWLHFIGNMWFLHIFGDNVEDRIGRIGFVIFYIFCGVMASVTHLLTNRDSPIPTIGASGAIAGVMGAYFLLYPKAMVTSLVPLLGFIQIIVIPAPVFLGIWFLLQFLQGALASTTVESTGVAWWAHVGGFFVGAAVAACLRAVGETRPPVQQRRPGTEHAGVYRYHRS